MWAVCARLQFSDAARLAAGTVLGAQMLAVLRTGQGQALLTATAGECAEVEPGCCAGMVVGDRSPGTVAGCMTALPAGACWPGTENCSCRAIGACADKLLANPDGQIPTGSMPEGMQARLEAGAAEGQALTACGLPAACTMTGLLAASVITGRLLLGPCAGFICTRGWLPSCAVHLAAAGCPQALPPASSCAWSAAACSWVPDASGCGLLPVRTAAMPAAGANSAPCMAAAAEGPPAGCGGAGWSAPVCATITGGGPACAEACTDAGAATQPAAGSAGMGTGEATVSVTGCMPGWGAAGAAAAEAGSQLGWGSSRTERVPCERSWRPAARAGQVPPMPLRVSSTICRLLSSMPGMALQPMSRMSREIVRYTKVTTAVPEGMRHAYS